LAACLDVTLVGGTAGCTASDGGNTGTPGTGSPGDGTNGPGTGDPGTGTGTGNPTGSDPGSSAGGTGGGTAGDPTGGDVGAGLGGSLDPAGIGTAVSVLRTVVGTGQTWAAQAWRTAERAGAAPAVLAVTGLGLIWLLLVAVGLLAAGAGVRVAAR
jgi:hypothetical protein